MPKLYISKKLLHFFFGGGGVGLNKKFYHVPRAEPCGNHHFLLMQNTL